MKNRPARCCCMARSCYALLSSTSPMFAIMGDEGDITTNFGYAERRGEERRERRGVETLRETRERERGASSEEARLG